MFKFGFSLLLIATVAIAISRRIRLSARYERAPKELTPWKAMDKGIDPTEEKQ
jgi:hypothetical protein